MDTIQSAIIRIIDRYRAAVRHRAAEAFIALYGGQNEFMTYAGGSPGGREITLDAEPSHMGGLMRREDAWLIAHQHTSVLIDPRGFKAIMRRKPGSR